MPKAILGKLIVDFADSVSYRQSTRLPLAVPITISGDDPGGEGFQEETQTVDVGKRGIRARTAHRLSGDAQVSISRTPSENALPARVVWQAHTDSPNDQAEIGVEFLESLAPEWILEAPPEDWLDGKLRLNAIQKLEYLSARMKSSDVSPELNALLETAKSLPAEELDGFSPDEPDAPPPTAAESSEIRKDQTPSVSQTNAHNKRGEYPIEEMRHLVDRLAEEYEALSKSVQGASGSVRDTAAAAVAHLRLVQQETESRLKDLGAEYEDRIAKLGKSSADEVMARAETSEQLRDTQLETETRLKDLSAEYENRLTELGKAKVEEIRARAESSEQLRDTQQVAESRLKDLTAEYENRLTELGKSKVAELRAQVEASEQLRDTQQEAESRLKDLSAEYENRLAELGKSGAGELRAQAEASEQLRDTQQMAESRLKDLTAEYENRLTELGRSKVDELRAQAEALAQLRDNQQEAESRLHDLSAEYENRLAELGKSSAGELRAQAEASLANLRGELEQVEARLRELQDDSTLAAAGEAVAGSNDVPANQEESLAQFRRELRREVREFQEMASQELQDLLQRGTASLQEVCAMEQKELELKSAELQRTHEGFGSIRFTQPKGEDAQAEKKPLSPTFYGALLLAVAMLVCAFAFFSTQPQWQLQTSPPAAFLDSDVSRNMLPAEKELARAYWQCAINVIQGSYGFGAALPADPPPGFAISPQDAPSIHSRAYLEASQARYWEKLRQVWNDPNVWIQTYQWNTDWFFSPLKALGKMLRG